MRNGRMERGAAAVLLAGAVIAAGCGRAADGVSARQRSQQKATAAGMAEQARADYRPPADGRLTRAQIDMYLEVRERAGRIRQAAVEAAQAARGATGSRADGGAARRGERSDLGDGATAELRAAEELHRGPKEFLWVKARVLEAQAAEATRALLRKMSLGREQLIHRLRAERAQLADPAARAEAARQLAALERGLAESEPAVPREVEANMRLLGGYRGRLARLQQLEERTLVRAAAGVEPGAEGGAPPAPGAAGALGTSGRASAQ